MRVELIAACLAVPMVVLALPPTFNKDVQPILAKNCQSCHRPGEVAPMSLLTYAEARPWAKSIKTAVLTKRMPPWFADQGHFRNDKSLSAAEIATLTAWVDGGAPEGDVKDRPAARIFPNGWNIKPDMVIEIPKAVELPASGTINYKFVLVRTNFKEDLWVMAAEMRPGDPKVLHHGKVWVRPPGSRWMTNAVPGEAYELETQFAMIGNNDYGEGNDILGKFNPGLGAQDFSIDGAAKLIPKGSDLVFEMHYTASGKPAKDVPKVGLVLAKRPPQKRYFFHPGPSAFNMVIRPREANAEIVSEVTTTEPMNLVYAQPHMHLRGKDFELRLIYPTGESEVVLKGRFNFEWQLGYEFAKPIPLPAGTRMLLTTHFDNSANNTFNPDANATVIWGPQNWDEMSNVFIGVTVPKNSNAFESIKLSGPSLLPRGVKAGR